MDRDGQPGGQRHKSGIFCQGGCGPGQTARIQDPHMGPYIRMCVCRHAHTHMRACQGHENEIIWFHRDQIISFS